MARRRVVKSLRFIKPKRGTLKLFQALKQLLDGVLAFFQERGPRSEERRRLIRLRCDYAVQCVMEQEQFAGHVADMGLNGMRLQVEQKLKPGSKIFVYHPAQGDKVENEYVLCLVRWCRKRREGELYDLGLQYVDTPGNMRRSWVKFLLKELGFDERAIYTRRKSIRAEASLEGKLTAEDGREIPGTVVNLGAGGALFQCTQPFPPTTRVRLWLGALGRIRAVELPAVVIHSKRPRENGPHFTSLRFEELNARQVRVLGQNVLHLLKAQES